VAGQGGSPAAGAANGGATTAGGGGLATPDGCTYTSHLVGGLFCSLEMTCDEERVIISCDVDSNTWRCGCVRGDERVGFYFFPDASGVRTCEVAATICMNPELLDVDEVCTLTDAPSSESCTVTETCTRPLEVDRVTVETRSEWTASCEPCGNALHACCRCEENGFPDYRLRASEVSEGCLHLDRICRQNGEITPLGGDECVTYAEEATPSESCLVGMTCEYPSELDDGTSLTLAGTFETSCTSLEDSSVGDVTLCSCVDADGWDALEIVYEPPGLFVTNCIDTNRACAGLVRFEPMGAADCSDYFYPTSETESCLYQRRCLQPGALLGTEVRALTGADIACQLESDGRWSCFCYDALKNEENVLVELESAEGLESVCAEAIERCPMVPKATF
jgi:hypothetical protein